MKKQIIIIFFALLGTSIFSAEDNRQEIRMNINHLAEKINDLNKQLRYIHAEIAENIGDLMEFLNTKFTFGPINNVTPAVLDFWFDLAKHEAENGNTTAIEIVNRRQALIENRDNIRSKIRGLQNKMNELNEMLQR